MARELALIKVLSTGQTRSEINGIVEPFRAAILPSRELIADSAETVINAHWFDGVFYIPNCDKITPGILMVSVRTNVPSVFV